ncbi:MAG: hypothetical protein IKO51_02685 [Clostridia bacterium]|nr:hypothetical protein [Clostridia bacterium]
MDEKENRKRGRPKIDADFTEQLVTSRRAQLNAKYMFDGMVLIKNSPEITEPEMLWQEDPATSSAISKNGILEQLGRMTEQDHLHPDDGIFFANRAIDALKAGYTSREVEKALRAIRMAIKKADGTPENSYERYQITMAINYLISMQ